jgi:putative spermidine/putrescine transport system permease protein
MLTYGQFGTFRSSWLFILVGHVLFTLAVPGAPGDGGDATPALAGAGRGRASLGAGPIKRFFSVVVPNCRAGILPGC